MSLVDLHFLLLFFLPFLLIAIFAFKKIFRLATFDLLNIVLGIYLIQNHVGLIYLYFAYDYSDHRYFSIDAFNKLTLIKLAGFSSIVVISYFFSNSIWNLKNNLSKLLDNQAQTRSIGLWAPLILILCVTILCFIVFNNSPLFIYFSDGFSSANIRRIDAASMSQHILGVKQSYVRILFEIVFFVSIYFLVKFFDLQRKRFLLLFIVFNSVAMLYWFSNLSKGAILLFVLSIFFVDVILRKQGAFFKLTNVVWMALVTLIVGVASSWFMDILSQESWSYAFYRLCLGNLIPQYYLVDVFTTRTALLGMSFPRWVLFGYYEYQFLLDEFVWQGLNPQVVGASYTAPSSFVAEGYANFKTLGVIFWCFLTFFLLGCLQSLMLRIRDRAIRVSLLVYCGVHYTGLGGSGLIPFIFDYYLWGVLLFALVLTKFTFYSHRPRKIATVDEGARQNLVS